jgi:hypothetical protein
MPRTSKPPGGNGDSGLYDRVSARARTAIMQASAQARDIAPSPEVQDRARRDRACGDLEFFLRTYFPRTFRLSWSADHVKIIQRLQEVVTSGGQYALATSRAGGKTSLLERGCLWGVLTGRRRFIVVVCATEGHAERLLGRLKSELECNPLLLADFPRECYPIKRLEGQSRRTVGQLYEQQRTRIVWQRKTLVLPTMPPPDNLGSGAILQACGLTSAVRGLSWSDESGTTFRPDCILVDDPQDRSSAKSVVQTSDRLQILNGDLLALGGPEQRIAALCATTVICRGDLAHQILDRSRHPAWQGETYRLVLEWPSRSDLWKNYLNLRREGQMSGEGTSAATEFYRSHRSLMDEGARVSWPERFEPGELSAIQHCFNLRQDRGEDVWASEFQNEPLEPARDLDSLDPMRIASRCNGFDRGVAPPEVEKLTAFIDVGSSILWWMVCGWDEAFGCAVLDYGCWPEQNARVFLARNASPTLEQKYRGSPTEEARVYAGLSDVVKLLTGRDWQRSDGASLTVCRILIDSGWNAGLVRLFIRQHERWEILTASKGFGVGAGQKAIADYHRKPGEKIGDGWILGLAGPDRSRLLRYDTNLGKTRIASMLTRPMGEKGLMTLFGDRQAVHELLALQLTSEFPTRTEAKGNTVNIWSRRPDRDNHWLDCAVGCSVAASLEGISPLSVVGGGRPTRQERKRVSFKQMYEAKHGANFGI